MNARQGLTIAVVVLLLALIGVGWWAFSLSTDKETLTEQGEQLTTQNTELDALKAELQHQVDSLQTAYASLAEENQSLQGSVSDSKKRVAEKEAAIKKIKSQTSKEASSLKEQIQELLKVKDELTGSIGGLRAENDSLRALTGQLTADLATSQSEKAELARLNETIQGDLKKLTLQNFKASAFRVEVETKKPKATSKAGRARRLLVSFDLTGVKPEYRGLRTLYLVVTDDKGTPIKESTPIQAKVTVNGQEMDIQAVQAKEVNVAENQRLDFNHELEDKLKRGFYRVAVYTDVGLLGAASFRLQ